MHQTKLENSLKETLKQSYAYMKWKWINISFTQELGDPKVRHRLPKLLNHIRYSQSVGPQEKSLLEKGNWNDRIIPLTPSTHPSFSVLYYTPVNSLVSVKISIRLPMMEAQTLAINGY